MMKKGRPWWKGGCKKESEHSAYENAMEEMIRGIENDNEMPESWTHGIITLLHKKK